MRISLDFNPMDHPEAYDVDLLTAGLPRVKSNSTVTRRSPDTELRLIEATAYLVRAVQPRSLVIENMTTLVEEDFFAPIRDFLRKALDHLGYDLIWVVRNAADFGVPQYRKTRHPRGLKQQRAGESDRLAPPPRSACRSERRWRRRCVAATGRTPTTGRPRRRASRRLCRRIEEPQRS
ncbi:DNA cytosine methyltransferase [Streptomyces sp. NPDC048417]|uniref:DNA cytosine methyltransferase n=1 Tax=Streptomyces sp. NPDC048417 TaxID=3155387 RepID=UPI00342B8D71